MAAREKKKQLVNGIWLVLPLIIFSTIVIVYPLINTVVLSFNNQKIIGAPSDFVGLGTYLKVIKNEAFWDALKLSLLWTLGNVIVNNCFAMFVALLLFQRFRGHSILESVILLPWVIPNVVSVVIWRFILHPTLGIANSLMMDTGLFVEPLLFLADKNQALATIIGVNVWTFFGLRTLVILAALIGIPNDLLEAAKVDGAGPFRRFISIIWPSIVPVISVVVLLGGFQTFTKVEIIWLFTRGGPGTSTTTLPILLYQKAYMSQRVSEAAVISVLIAVILAVVAAIYFKHKSNEEDF